MRLRRLVCGMLVLALGAGASAEEDTQYFAVFVDGKKIGHCKRTREVRKEEVHSSDTTVMTMSRMGTQLTLRMVESCVETAEGKPLRFQSVQDLGIVVTTLNGTIDAEGKLQITGSTLGGPQQQTTDWPEGAVLTEGLRLREKKEGLKPGTSYQVTIYMPSLLQAVQADVKVGPKKPVDVLGRVVRLTEVQATMSTPQGQIQATEYVDDQLRSLKSLSVMAGMKVELLACSKAFALSPDDVVDFLKKTLVASPRPLGKLSAAKAVSYHLEPASDRPLKIPSTDRQAVRAGTAGRVVVTVRAARAAKGATFPYRGSDEALRAALKPTRYLQCDSKKLIAAARRAVAGAADAGEAAGKIESHVAGYITKKDLSVGYASALEVLESRQGDCSEHAVLTGAMCRAVGIPARIVVGVVYVPQLGGKNGAFGAHAWVEACVGGKWIGLDAAMGRWAPDRVALVVGHGGPEDFFGIVSSLGNFRIARVEVTP